MDVTLAISVTMKVCDGTPHARCIVRVTVAFQDELLIINGGRTGDVALNGEVLTMPFSNDEIYVKQVTSLFKLIRGFGFHILYDGAQRIYVNLGPFYLNKVNVQYSLR